MGRNLPNSRYSIRRAAGPADLAALRSLLEAYVRTLPPGKCDDEPVERSLKVYSREPNAAWIAHSGGAGIGCVALRMLDVETARIERLFVLEEYRGRGIGLALCRTAVRFAHRRAYSRVVLDTLPDMVEAQALYRSLGFVESEEPDWPGCSDADRIYMVLQFKE